MAESSGEIITAPELEAAVVRDALARWQAVKGPQPYPETPDEVMARVSSNIILVKVLGDGEDYQYLRVGEALVAGFGADFSGQCLSEIEQTNPRFGIGLRMLYEMVRASGEPLCYRGWAGQDMPGARFIYYESAVLPFGRAPKVDTMLVISMLVLRGDSRPGSADDLRV
jgi:hypothetical protein